MGNGNHNEMKEHYLKYFRLFKDNAPSQMVEWGGYQKGEPTGMASSLECCLAFASIVKDKEAVILNAGAGASSFVLRKLFKNVICTDPDPEYLEVVKKICALDGLNTDNFIANALPKCDYCLYDYGNIVRIPMMMTAIENTKYGLYIDDCDTRLECKEMRDYVYNLGMNVRDCADAVDEYGRWGVILEK